MAISEVPSCIRHNWNGEHTALRGALWRWLPFHQLCGGLMIARITCPTRSLECGVRGDVSDFSVVSASSHLSREHTGHQRHPQNLHDLESEPILHRIPTAARVSSCWATHPKGLHKSCSHVLPSSPPRVATDERLRGRSSCARLSVASNLMPLSRFGFRVQNFEVTRRKAVDICSRRAHQSLYGRSDNEWRCAK